MADDPVLTHQIITVADMVEELRAEASRIDGTQKVLVATGVQDAPSETAIRRRDVYDHAALLLERISPYLDELRDIVRRRNRRAR